MGLLKLVKHHKFGTALSPFPNVGCGFIANFESIPYKGYVPLPVDDISHPS
jgi:hypothetical protein